MSRELTRLWLFRGSLSLGIVGILAGGGAFAAPVDHPASAPSSPGSAMVMITGATASVGSSGATSSAMITINGKAVGRIPTSLRLQAGRYFVEVTRPGYKTWRHWLDVKAATPTTLRVKMAAAISKPTTGALLVAADILVSEVFVDGKSVGKVPALVANLSPGAHRIEVRAQGYAPVLRQATIVLGKTTKVSVRLKPTTELKIVCEPPGVEVWLDGQKKGLAPLVVSDLKAGKHLVEGRLTGYLSVQETVDVSEGKVITVKLDLKAISAAPSTGALRVTCAEAQALVFIDGRFVGKTPLLRQNIVVGAHVITIRKRGFEDTMATVDVKAGKIAGLQAKLEAGGKSQPASMSTSRPASQPSKVKAPVRDIRKMNSHSALLVAPAFIAADISFGFPSLIEARLTAGIFDLGRVGMDAGVVLQTYFAVTEVAGRVRLRLLSSRAFSLAAVTEVGGGGGPKSRNTFHFDFGATGTWQYKRLFNMSVTAALSIYSDRLCPETPGSNEVGACNRPPAGLTVTKTRGRFTSARFLVGATVSVPVTDWLSVFGGIQVAAAADRRAFSDAFAAYMPESDSHVYGRLGVTFKR